MGPAILSGKHQRANSKETSNKMLHEDHPPFALVPFPQWVTALIVANYLPYPSVRTYFTTAIAVYEPLGTMSILCVDRKSR